MKDFKDSLVNGFAWQASTKLFVQIFSWVSTIWVARLLVPEDYGLVAMSGIVSGVFLLLVTSGLAAGVVNRKEVTKGELDTVFWFSVLKGRGLYADVRLFYKISISFNLELNGLFKNFTPSILSMPIVLVLAIALMGFVKDGFGYSLQIIVSSTWVIIAFYIFAQLFVLKYVHKVRLIVVNIISKRKLRNA